ncbi:hypothetical protein Pcinc_022571 [Petrolisthes cinctipes]|uniref:Ig-like domain-containing protein n=1 Tax=Petrolisthes cinctipes TaxID=88211 RepID=A0AAE1FDG4_PETCI|nr:hypothetical protein Pcinc_022571 [Petrolisthes cinctipes]
MLVSWIRHRDLHVLTVGSFTFTTDNRFSAHRDPGTGEWVLVLRRPLPSDSGFYECSISTKPVTAMSVKLEVLVPTAEMTGEGSVFLDRGSTLNLTCLVHFSPTPPEFILWYHQDKLVNYGSREGRQIKVTTQHSGDTTQSSLLVHNATMWDSGWYSCKPANAARVSTRVHVLKSETPAAMQTTTSGSPPASAPAAYLISRVLLLVSCSLAERNTEPPIHIQGSDAWELNISVASCVDHSHVIQISRSAVDRRDGDFASADKSDQFPTDVMDPF